MQGNSTICGQGNLTIEWHQMELNQRVYNTMKEMEVMQLLMLIVQSWVTLYWIWGCSWGIMPRPMNRVRVQVSPMQGIVVETSPALSPRITPLR